jgi:hypothetical protein
MRKLLNFFLLLTIFLSSTPLAAQETSAPRRTAQRGDGAGYSTRDATVLSMMGWGLGLALGIALICGYITPESNNIHSSSGSSSSGGSTSH